MNLVRFDRIQELSGGLGNTKYEPQGMPLERARNPRFTGTAKGTVPDSTYLIDFKLQLVIQERQDFFSIGSAQ